MIARALPLLAILLACEGSETGARLETQPASDENLIGAWDAKLSLTHGYQLAGEPPSRVICGTLGFVDNRHGAVVVGPRADGLGVYDLDLSRLGLNWVADEGYPEALLKTSREHNRTAGVSRDSVTIVLNPGSTERIVLLGRQDGIAIDGVWTAQSLRGTATGQFSLRPHGHARPSC